MEYRSERSEGGYAAKAGNVGAGANYDAQTGKVNKPTRTAPPPGGSIAWRFALELPATDQHPVSGSAVEATVAAMIGE